MSPPDSVRVRLVAATIESIHRHGLEATTVSSVTELAGLSRGMVRHVFTSKHQMLVATFEHLRDEWTQMTDVPDEVEAGGRAREIVMQMFAPAAFTDAQVAAWLALSVAASTDDQLRTVREECQAVWEAQLGRAFQAAGVSAPREAAQGMLAAADGLWLHHRLGGGSRERARATALRVCDALTAES